MSAAIAVPTQQSVASTASAVPAGASSAAQQQRVAAGGQVPTQAGQAASAAYPAQEGVVDAGSNVPTQGSQAATSAQGAVDMGTNVPVQQSVAATGSASVGNAGGSTAEAALPQRANSNKAPLQPVQAQLSQSPSVSHLAFWSPFARQYWERSPVERAWKFRCARSHTAASGNPVKEFKTIFAFSQQCGAPCRRARRLEPWHFHGSDLVRGSSGAAATLQSWLACSSGPCLMRAALYAGVCQIHPASHYRRCHASKRGPAAKDQPGGCLSGSQPAQQAPGDDQAGDLHTAAARWLQSPSHAHKRYRRDRVCRLELRHNSRHYPSSFRRVMET